MSNESDYDTTEKVERTDTGYRVTVESTRGTGTRDQDKVKVEQRSETRPSESDVEGLITAVRDIMNARRAHQPDGENDA